MNDYLIIKSKIRPYLKYYLLTHKEIPKHIVNIINQTPPITLENTLELPLENFKINGRTEQTQLQGYNLFDYTQVKNLAFGTKQDASGNYILQNAKYRGYYIQVDPNVTYIISRKNTTDFSRFRVCCTEVLPVANVPVISGSIVNGDGLTDLSITIPENGHYLFLYLSNSDEDITPEMEVQITKSEELLPYEPYCGGQASPSPDYPQPINNVSGDITISVSDENNTNSQEVVFPLAEGQKLMEGDYLAEDGVHHVRGKFTLDGNQPNSSFNINANLSTQNYNCFFYNDKALIKQAPNDTAICVIANKLKGTSSKQRTADMANCWINHLAEGQLGMHIPNNVTSIAELQAWLTNNPIEFEVIRKEETIDPYTPAQLESYNNFKNLHGYNNITIVNATSSNLTPNLSFDYYAKGR